MKKKVKKNLHVEIPVIETDIVHKNFNDYAVTPESITE